VHLRHLALDEPLPAHARDEPGEVFETAASQAGHHRPVEPVQELPSTSAFHQHGDELSRGAMAQDPHRYRTTQSLYRALIVDSN
jgi:hypothetical protein